MTQAPTISGTPRVGSTLTAAKGSWSGNPTGYAFAWSRCDKTGSSCAAISGATADTYNLAQVDGEATLRVTVTASNSAGSTSATAVPTAIVQSPPLTVVNGCPASGSRTIQVPDAARQQQLLVLFLRASKPGDAITGGISTRLLVSFPVALR